MAQKDGLLEYLSTHTRGAFYSYSQLLKSTLPPRTHARVTRSQLHVPRSTSTSSSKNPRSHHALDTFSYLPHLSTMMVSSTSTRPSTQPMRCSTAIPTSILIGNQRRIQLYAAIRVSCRDTAFPTHPSQHKQPCRCVVLSASSTPTLGLIQRCSHPSVSEINGTSGGVQRSERTTFLSA